MPITPQEALEKVESLDLKGDEIKWFERLCQYADYHIDKFFDGNSVNVKFDNMFIPNPDVPRGQINCGPLCYHGGFPHWRQGAVVKVWIKTYEDLGWKVIPCGEELRSYNNEYRFELDKRDMKLNEILS